MKTLAQLRAEVTRIVQDASYTDTIIDGYINDGLLDIAGQVFLPRLEASDTVDTDTSVSYVVLPTDYHRGLYRCYSTTNSTQIRVYENLPLLLREFGQLDLAGRVVGVAVRGDELHYQYLPSTAETLSFHYSAKPIELEDDADEPTCLPDFLVRPLLVSYVCAEIYDQIEDEVDGVKLNTNNYRTRYAESLAKLVSFIGPDALNQNRELQSFGDEMNLDAYL